MACILDCALHTSLLISAERRHRPRFEAVVAGELQQGGIEADGIPDTLRDGTFKVVVEQDARHRAKPLKGAHVAGQEVRHAHAVEEAQVDAPRVREHHDKRDELAAGLADLDAAEDPPIDLALLPWQRAQAQVSLRHLTRPVAGAHEAPQMVGGSRIAAPDEHLVQAADAEPGVLGEGLLDEGHERVDRRHPNGGRDGHALLLENAADDGVMDAELRGDGADGPLLGVVEAQDAGLSIRGMGHGVLLRNPGWWGSTRPRRRMKSRRTKSRGLMAPHTTHTISLAAARGPLVASATTTTMAGGVEAGGEGSVTRLRRRSRRAARRRRLF